jgi:hypothetical protein
MLGDEIGMRAQAVAGPSIWTTTASWRRPPPREASFEGTPSIEQGGGDDRVA